MEFQSFNSDFASQVGVQLELAKCLTRLDQPNAALDVFSAASEKFSGDTYSAALPSACGKELKF